MTPGQWLFLGVVIGLFLWGLIVAYRTRKRERAALRLAHAAERASFEQEAARSGPASTAAPAKSPRPVS